MIEVLITYTKSVNSLEYLPDGFYSNVMGIVHEVSRKYFEMIITSNLRYHNPSL